MQKGNLSLRLILCLSIMFLTTNASFSQIPSCYPTAPWDNFINYKKWPTPSHTTNMSQSQMHNYIHTSTAKDDGEAYWAAIDSDWIAYANLTIENAWDNVNMTVNPPAGDAHWWSMVRLQQPELHNTGCFECN